MIKGLPPMSTGEQLLVAEMILGNYCAGDLKAFYSDEYKDSRKTVETFHGLILDEGNEDLWSAVMELARKYQRRVDR